MASRLTINAAADAASTASLNTAVKGEGNTCNGGSSSRCDEATLALIKEVKQLVHFLREVAPDLAGKMEMGEAALLERPDVLNSLRVDVANAVQAAVKKLDMTDVYFVKSFFNLSTKDITKQYFVAINWLDTSSKRRGCTMVPFSIRGNVEAKLKRLERMNECREAAAAARRKRKCFSGTADSPSSPSTSSSGSGGSAHSSPAHRDGGVAAGEAEAVAEAAAEAAAAAAAGEDDLSSADDFDFDPVRLLHPFSGQHLEKVEKPRGKCVFSTNEPLTIACMRSTIVIEGVAIFREMCTASGGHTTQLRMHSHGRQRVIVDSNNIVGWPLAQPMGGRSVVLPWQDVKRLNVFYPYCDASDVVDVLDDEDDDGDGGSLDSSLMNDARSDAFSLISVCSRREQERLMARDNSTSMLP